MSINFIYPEFEIVRNNKCNNCGACINQCSNEVHFFDENKRVLSDESKCVNCQRCVSFCPQKALKIKLGLPLKLYLRKKKSNKTIIYI